MRAASDGLERSPDAPGQELRPWRSKGEVRRSEEVGMRGEGARGLPCVASPRGGQAGRARAGWCTSNGWPRATHAPEKHKTKGWALGRRPPMGMGGWGERADNQGKSDEAEVGEVASSRNLPFSTALPSKVGHAEWIPLVGMMLVVNGRPSPIVASRLRALHRRWVEGVTVVLMYGCDSHAPSSLNAKPRSRARVLK